MKERAGAVLRKMRVENLGAAERHRKRQRPTGETFRIAGDIGRHVGLLAGEQRPGAAPAGHYLVGYEQNIRRFADPFHLLEHPGRIHQHPARAQDQRLHDKRCWTFMANRGLERIERRLLMASGWKRDGCHVEQQRSIGGVEHAARADRHRPDGVTVIGVLHHDDAASWLAYIVPVTERHFERHFHAGRATVGKENVLKAARRKFQDRRGDFFGRFVRKAGEYDLVELFGLFLNSTDDWRMAVAMGHDPPGCDRIDDPAAILRIEAGALPAHDLRHLALKRVLGERMPDRRFSAHIHDLKSSGLNEDSNAARNVFAVNGESRGNRPSRLTRPISQMMRSLSPLSSPIKAIPRISSLRCRSASIDSSEWLIVPSAVRAQSTTGSRHRAKTSI